MLQESVNLGNLATRMRAQQLRMRARPQYSKGIARAFILRMRNPMERQIALSYDLSQISENAP
jgi:hypothetical protein